MSSVDLDAVNTRKDSLISPIFVLAQLLNRAMTSTISLVCSLLNSIYSFIQHLSEIRYLDRQKLLRSIPAAITNCLTELKPGSVPQISAGERMRLLDDYLGLPYNSFLPRWGKERLGVCSYRKHTFLSIDGSRAGFNGRLESTRKARQKDDD